MPSNSASLPVFRPLEEELQQHSFESLEQKAMLNLIFTHNWLMSRLAIQLKEGYGLTTQQFNILRILRGQKGQPISLLEVKSRMLDRNSDTSRIVDRMVKKGLVDRRTCPADRRQVDLTITTSGNEVLSHADTLMGPDNHPLGNLNTQEQQQLICLMDAIRGGRQ